MKIGFTGSREGISERQAQQLEVLLIDLQATEFHHGDCIGADAEAHAIAKRLGIHTTAHPGNAPSMRAFCDADEVRPAKAMLPRNWDIVSETELLIAAPAREEEMRSGTWATVRYARKQKKRRYILRRL